MPVKTAVVANASPVGWLSIVGRKNSAVISVAATNVKNRKENRVIANETSASSIVATPIKTTDQEPSWKGSKNGSFGNVPTSDATPNPTAGTIAAARANPMPPGTHHAYRRNNHPPIAYA